MSPQFLRNNGNHHHTTVLSNKPTKIYHTSIKKVEEENPKGMAATLPKCEPTACYDQNNTKENNNKQMHEIIERQTCLPFTAPLSSIERSESVE